MKIYQIYNILLVLPSKLIDAILPAPDTFASATLFAVVANDTAPDTFAPATAFAVVADVANATAPDTLAPATAFAVVANDTAPLTLLPATALAVAAFVTSPEMVAAVAISGRLDFEITDVEVIGADLKITLIKSAKPAEGGR